MSEQPLGPGWWQASDGRWYPPEQWTGPPGTRPPISAGPEATTTPAAGTPTAATPERAEVPHEAVGSAAPTPAPAPRAAGTGAPQRYCGSLLAVLAEGWVAREVLTFLAPDGQANAIASSEPLDPMLDSARYAEQQGASLRGFPEHEEHSFEGVTLFGDRSACLRVFSWRPPDGVRVSQLQLTYAEHGYSVLATGTTPVTQWDRYGMVLRETLLSLSLPLGPGWWQASDLRWYPPEQWTGLPGTLPAAVPGAAGSGIQPGASQCATTLSAVLPGGWFSKEQLVLRAPDGQANVIFSTEPLEATMDSRRYADSQGKLLAEQCPQYQEFSLDAVTIFGEHAGFLRRFRWTPSGGVPVSQLQAYFVRGPRGFTATATTPATVELRNDPVIRTVLAGLRIGQQSIA